MRSVIKELVLFLLCIDKNAILMTKEKNVIFNFKRFVSFCV